MRISLDTVTRSYGSFVALDAVSLEFEPGQIVALLGPNGAGKTTLLRALGGVLPPDRGRVLIDGETRTRARVDMRRRMGFVPDAPLAYPEMTVLRHIGMVLRLYEADGPGADDRVVELLRDFELLPLIDLPFNTLSRGQAYKASLVAVLASRPDAWLLDEPFASGMDPDGIIALKRRMREAAARGCTVIYTTQILEIAEGCSDRVCILDRGVVRAFDSVARLSETPGAKGSVLEELFRRLREERA